MRHHIDRRVFHSLKTPQILRVVIITSLLISLAVGARADSVEGNWSGSARALGRRFSASCSFNGRGGFSAKAAGMSASGSYSISGNSVTLSARGTSITFTLTTSGNKQSLSGSGKYRGISGSIYLSRTIPAGSSTTSSSPYGEWMCEADDVIYTLWLYEDGYARLTALDTNEADSIVFDVLREGFAADKFEDLDDALEQAEAALTRDEFIATMKSTGKKLTFTPLSGDYPAMFPSGEVDYTVKDGKLMLLKSGDSYEYEFEKLSNTPKTPLDEAFRPYITLKRGDKGDLVKRLQQRLIEEGFLDGAADGDFGKLTEAAVRAYEQQNNLPDDGEADPEIMALLLDD